MTRTDRKAEWFDPAEALGSVRGLLRQLRKSARGVKNGRQVIKDLGVLEWELAHAEEYGVRFQFVVLD